MMILLLRNDILLYRHIAGAIQSDEGFRNAFEDEAGFGSVGMGYSRNFHSNSCV